MSYQEWPSKRSGRIHVYDMWDGEVAQILGGPSQIYHGQIVQRWDTNLISLGVRWGASWPGIFVPEYVADWSGGGLAQMSDFWVNLLPGLQKQLYSKLPIYPVTLPPPAIVARDPFRRLEFDDEVDQ